ncbi:Gfo/Idh/MocA family protein [Labilibacter marinus]|uniref:Gfo/Idh/MocA family protein n=1 Tax=Labilibacter marinus TaxID=1477105 RepID=UPI000829CC12|nr:Gfo/Idh/MocA family oxidoreductase [Labilibacter marinus]
MKKYKGVAIGAGYFSGFQYEAWQRMPEVDLVAMSNRNEDRAKPIMEKYEVARHYTDWKKMIDEEKPDFVDIITPPETHLEMVTYAANKGVDIICQKPLAPTFEEAVEVVEVAKKAGVRFMVHENFRFQPWHREIRQLIDQDEIGQVHSLFFRSRMGDGWGEDAYLARQPYFRDYPKLLIYETGIHFIDTFRYHAGEVKEVFAKLRRLNSVIKGEDRGMVQLFFEKGTWATWDANRFNEPNFENSRYTFGHYLVEGEKGAIRLYPDGKITIQKLGEKEVEREYKHVNNGFAGDCCYITQRHFVDCLIDGSEFETNGDDYLRSLKVQEAVYESADTGTLVQL